MSTPLRRSRRALSLAAALVAVAIAWPQAARAGNRSFSPGSIIIPAQLEYQDGDTNSDGTIAAYGLIYSVLAKNADRVRAGKRPIAIYWAVEPRKLSHHRCETSNDDLPNYETYNDDDGCDFAIQSAAGQPVVEIDASFQEVSNFSVNGLAYSNGRVTRSGTFRIGPSKRVVKYSGGAWIIDATDRNDFLKLLQEDDALAHFHRNGAGRHFVKLHGAQASFEAYIQRAINQKPPTLAIVGKGTENILTDYLSQAGLDTVFGDELGGTPDVPGKVYDVLDPLTHFVESAQFPCGVLNKPDGEDVDGTRCGDLGYDYDSYYKVLWAADWKIDSGSTYPAGWEDRDGAKANALANIGTFVDRGNGLFAEDSAIVTFEGIALGGTVQCTELKVCTNLDTGSTQPFTCADGQTPSRCDGGATCYTCPAGTVLDDTSCPGRCVPTAACPAGYEVVGGTCYSCPAGYALNKNNPNAVSCVPADGSCPANFQSVAGGCYACSPGLTLDPQVGDVICHAPCSAGNVWDTAKNACVKPNGKVEKTATAPPLVPTASSYPTPSSQPAAGTQTPSTSSPLACPATHPQLTCGGTLGEVDGGSEETRFQTAGGVRANGISGTFSGADCNDYGLPAGSFFRANPGATGHDCVDYHADDRVPAILFSQKGNFDFTATTGGNIQDYTGVYKRGTWQLVGSARVDSSGQVIRTGGNAGFDFATMRHKDGDPAKGLVVYLSGHQYKFDFWGLRIILNTLLNLGLDDGDTEIARSEPVGFRDANAPAGEQDYVFQGTYREQPPPIFNDWREFSPVSPESFRFPFIRGHLRAYRADAISTGGQDFTSNRAWDAAAELPAPADRRIFTILGGSAHHGWHQVDFVTGQTQSGCTADFDADGKCDLAEELARGGTAGIWSDALKERDSATAEGERQRNLLGTFVQIVRGHCAAFDADGDFIQTPTNAQCTDISQQKNVARLGGIDHSSPAIVGPSRYGAATTEVPRPVVAYVGARDGMLHAFYVSGGAGFPGLGTPDAGQELWAFIPPGQLPWLHTNNAMVDAAINVIDVFADFPRDVNDNGTIEWGVEGERPDGVREWRTVLLAAAGQESKNLVVGQGGLELFAMDVTDPLKPVLLWHVTGHDERDGRWDYDHDGFDRDASGTVTETFDHAKPSTYALVWRDWNDGDAGTTHIPARYEETDSTRLRNYRSGRYDYSNLGFTYGTSIGKVWEGTGFRYVAYVVTSSVDFNSGTPSGFPGLEVFAIDLVTGQKNWQWQKRYGVKTTNDASGKIIAANDIPGRPALADVDADGSVDRIYVGDLEGRMWELDARDGRNLIYWPVKDSDDRVSLPLFGAPRMTGTTATAATRALFTDADGDLVRQPLTSPIGLGRLSTTSPELAEYLQGRLALVQGTMGVNWSIAPFERGNVFVLPAYPETNTRIPLPPEGVDLAALAGEDRDPREVGVILRESETEGAWWKIELGVGERVYGMPRVVNDRVVFDTAFGDFTGDQLSSTLFDQGNLVVATADGAPTSTPVVGKSFAGVLIFGNNVIVTSATGLMRFDAAEEGLQEGGFSQRAFNRSTPAVMKTWELMGEVVAPDRR